jgi:hypothetical protein
MKPHPIFAPALAASFYLFGKHVLLPRWGMPIRFGIWNDLTFLAFIILFVITDLLVRKKKKL